MFLKNCTEMNVACSFLLFSLILILLLFLNNVFNFCLLLFVYQAAVLLEQERQQEMAKMPRAMPAVRGMLVTVF